MYTTIAMWTLDFVLFYNQNNICFLDRYNIVDQSRTEQHVFIRVEMESLVSDLPAQRENRLH